MTKLDQPNDKAERDNEPDIVKRLGLILKNGWYVRPSRGGPPITSEEIERLIEDADLEDAGLKPSDSNDDHGDLRARAVEFTATELVVVLADGRKIATPLDWYPRLKRASAAQRQNYEIMPMGIHWSDIDEDLSIAGMLKGRRGV